MESVRPMFAAEIRKRAYEKGRADPLALAPGRGLREDQWRAHYLWRAVDHEGEVLESFVTKSRDKAALNFIKKAMRRHGRPKAIVTDGLRSCGAAMNDLGNTQKQIVGRRADNQCENSHLPFRRRERAMLRFPQMKTLQKFSSAHAAFHNHFNQAPPQRPPYLQTEPFCRPGRAGVSWRPERPQTSTLRRPAQVCLTMPVSTNDVLTMA